MQVCENCGAQLQDKDRFCTKCGSKSSHIVSQNKPTSENITNEQNDIDKKEGISDGSDEKKKTNIVPLALVSLLIAAAILAVILISTNPINVFKNNVESGNYLKAIEVYNDNIADNPNQASDAIKYLELHLQSVVDSFVAETIDYNTAVDKLDMIVRVGILDNYLLDGARFSINTLNESRIAYPTAQEFLLTPN